MTNNELVKQTDTSGSNTVTVKSTCYGKSRVSVCLAAKADSSKLPPFILFKGAKRDPDAMVLNMELTHVCVNKILSIFYYRRHLIWDSYECYIEGSIKVLLHLKKIDTTIVLRGCAKYIQVSRQNNSLI